MSGSSDRFARRVAIPVRPLKAGRYRVACHVRRPRGRFLMRASVTIAMYPGRKPLAAEGAAECPAQIACGGLRRSSRIEDPEAELKLGREPGFRGEAGVDQPM